MDISTDAPPHVELSSDHDRDCVYGFDAAARLQWQMRPDDRRTIVYRTAAWSLRLHDRTVSRCISKEKCHGQLEA